MRLFNFLKRKLLKRSSQQISEWKPREIQEPEEFTERLIKWANDPSSDPELEEWYRNGYPQGKPFSERKLEQWEKDHDEYYPMYQKALELERENEIDKALKIYLYIIDNYQPRGTAYYERPIYILKKKRRYSEALNICNKAIKAIENKKFNGDPKQFEKLKQTLS